MRTSFASFALAAALGCALPVGAANVTVKGSDTMVILAQKWAEVYMQQFPATRIQVTGGGTGVGFAALQNKTTDLCNASRKIRNWKQVGGKDEAIMVYSRENSSGTYEFFKEHVLKGRDFTASAQTLQGTAQVLQAVAAEPKAIGYGGAAYGAGAKHLKVSMETGGEAIEPTEDTVVGGTYPIWRYLFIYVNPALDKGELAAYLNWIRSDAGQQVVKDVGYYPLPRPLRQ
ncbi:MAG: substrate-binding domain-containing protein [Verrucomicrobia bacterium]|nr:substrate-binding domain-containing protein [Verrucomicrobiota bacterium]